MEKTVNERLFEALMRAPRSVKRALMEENFGDEMRGAHHGHGPGGCHRRGEGEGPMHGQDMMHSPGPMGMHGHGPMHGHGHMGMHGHGHMGMHGHGFGRERALRVIAGFEGGVRQKTLTEEGLILSSSVRVFCLTPPSKPAITLSARSLPKPCPCMPMWPCPCIPM